MTDDSVIDTEALIVGAGPVGLFQAFQLGLLEVRTHVVDALDRVGGQPVLLYPDKAIYDVPGIASCTGQALADGLMRQLAPVAPEFHLSRTVTDLARQDDGRWLVGTSGGDRFLTHLLFIAAGVGAFEPRRLTLKDITAFEGRQLFYRPLPVLPETRQHLVVIGDTDMALEAAMQWSDAGHEVTLMHRRDVFMADADTVQRMRWYCQRGAMRLLIAQPTSTQVEGSMLTGLIVARPDGQTEVVRADLVLALQGLSPKLGPIAQWGLAMERKQIVVDTATFSTSEPGVFAVGDINTYPGKRKLLVCGFHECVLAAYAGAQRLRTGHPIALEYTSSSSRLQRLLQINDRSEGSP